MQKRDVEQIVNNILPSWKQAFGIEDWDIEIEYATLPGKCFAETTTSSRYNHALIQMDTQKFQNEDQVLDIFRHELIHVLTADLSVYRKVICATMTQEQDKTEQEIGGWLWERLVFRIEAMLNRNLSALLLPSSRTSQ